MISSISIEDLLKMKPEHIIDIRNIQSYNNNHIPNAINIPFEKLITSPSKYLNPNVKYFIYCQKGLVSKKACQILSGYGYKVVDIIGGYEEWILNS